MILTLHFPISFGWVKHEYFAGYARISLAGDRSPELIATSYELRSPIQLRLYLRAWLVFGKCKLSFIQTDRGLKVFLLQNSFPSLNFDKAGFHRSDAGVLQR